MMMTTIPHPYARVRGAAVRSGAGHSLAARRRGEILLQAARRDEIASVTTTPTVDVDVVTPGLIHRLVHGGEGAKATVGRTVGVVLGLLAVVALTWPAQLLGRGLYGLWVWQHARFRPRAWVAAVVAVLALGLGVAAWWQTDHATNGDTVRSLWWALQPGLGFGLAAWLTHAWGWSAVTDGTTKRARITFEAVADDVDDDDEQQTTDTTETTDKESSVPLVQFVPVDDDDTDEREEK